VQKSLRVSVIVTILALTFSAMTSIFQMRHQIDAGCIERLDSVALGVRTSR